MQTFLRRLHGFLVGFWVALWITATFTGWIHSVTFVAHMSMAALVLGSWSAYQGARAEKRADEQG